MATRKEDFVVKCPRCGHEFKLPPEVLGSIVGKLLARANIFLKTKEPIDAVKLIREAWGET